MHGPLSIVEQHQLQWHCRQLCDTGIGMLGLAKMHHAQKGIQAEVIHLSALAISFAFRSVQTTQSPRRRSVIEGGVSCIASSMPEDQCRCHCVCGSSGKRERLADEFISKTPCATSSPSVVDNTV